MRMTATTAPAAHRLTIAERVLLADGWTRRAIAAGAGAVGALALAPVDLAPAMAAPLCVAVWLLDGCDAAAPGATRRFSLAGVLSAASAGWWLGLGYFVAGLWWVGAALLVEADQFAWALPLALLGVPAILACFTALGFALARLVWSPGSTRIFALAAGLGASEWLRGRLFTGFPWNDVGMALASVQPLAQSASLVGLHGLDILAIVIFAAPATIADRRGEANFATGAARIAAALLTLMLGYGALRLSTHKTEFVAGPKLRLMQPNLQQDAKFKPENGPEILRRYLALSDRATAPGRTGVADVTHLIWPESAFPFVLSRDPQALALISRGLMGKTLITGAARLGETPPTAAAPERRTKIFNAIEVVQGERIIASYDKRHLVPFGEYLPLESLLRPLGVQQLVPGTWDRGDGPARLQVPGLPLAAPLICYEAIFPGEVVDADAPRPQWLLNVTNDGWFGMTSGPYQHLAQARLRAIEEGLPLVRVANTGVSAVIDAYGRIIDQLPLGTDGVLDASLPKAAPPTVFARSPNFGFLLLLGAVAAIALWGRLRRR